MTDITKILFTAIGGVGIYVIGRIVEKFFIEPIYKYKKLEGNIADKLIYYADTYSNPTVAHPESQTEASNSFRHLASKLLSRTRSIPCYKLLATFFKCIPKKSNISIAHHNLIGLHSSLFNKDYKTTDDHVDKIKKALNIKTI